MSDDSLEDPFLRAIPVCAECWRKLFLDWPLPNGGLVYVGPDCKLCGQSAAIANVKCRVSIDGEAMIETAPSYPDELASVQLARALIGGYQRLAKARRPTLELIGRARDELRAWLWQLHRGDPPATEDGERVACLIGELDRAAGGESPAASDDRDARTH